MEDKKLHRHLTRKVEYARDALVTWIYDGNLQVGDRLPPYTKLREELKLGSQTITAAVASLCYAGVLEVRDKVGIFVKDPIGGHLAGRSVAVVVRRLAGSSYSAMLVGYIQRLLSEYNCRCLTFYQVSDPDMEPRPNLGDFSGLEQAVQERRIDGIITLCHFSDNAMRQFEKFGVKHCFVGDSDSNISPCAAVIDVQSFICEAAKGLREHGCRNVVQFYATLEQVTNRYRLIPGEIGNSYEGGAAIARRFLRMAPELRPDGIVSDDDTIVSGFLAELISEQPDGVEYLPMIATIVHDEIGEKYPSKRMLIYSQNIEEYTRMAVELLLKLIQGQVEAPAVESYCFKRLWKTADEPRDPKLNKKRK